MKAVYAFVAGNSRVTPIGIAIAAIAAVTLEPVLRGWTGALYLALLLLTLAIGTAEKPT